MKVTALWPPTLPSNAFLPRTQMADRGVNSHLMTLRIRAIC